MHWLSDFDTSWVAFWEKQSWQVTVWGVFHHLPRISNYWCPGKEHGSAYASYTAHGKKQYPPGGDKKIGAKLLPCHVLCFQHRKGQRRGGREQSSQGTGAPCSTLGWSGLGCGCLWPGEQGEIWEALDLQGRVWAALWAPILANAIAWKASQLSGFSWSSVLSSERLSWMLLCASHPSGCSQ